MTTTKGYLLALSGTYASALAAHTIARYSATGVDLKTVASAVIFTSEASLGRWITTDIIVEITASSAITVEATISVGTNAATYDDVLPASVQTGLTAANRFNHFYPSSAIDGVVTSVAASTGLRYNVSVAATGTSQTANIHILGFYVT